MGMLGEVKDLNYILREKAISKGSVTECIDERSLEVRRVGDLVAVITVNAHPLAGYDVPRGVPVYVIGARESDSKGRITVWREGFVEHPKYSHLCTSAHASKYLPLEGLTRMFELICSADDILDLKNFINRFYGTVC